MLVGVTSSEQGAQPNSKQRQTKGSVNGEIALPGGPVVLLLTLCVCMRMSSAAPLQPVPNGAAFCWRPSLPYLSALQLKGQTKTKTEGRRSYASPQAQPSLNQEAWLKVRCHMPAVCKLLPLPLISGTSWVPAIGLPPPAFVVCSLLPSPSLILKASR